MEGLIVVPVFFALMWVLFIFPQQKRVKAQQQFMAELQVDDRVVTAGGIHGTIVSLDTDVVRLEVADGVELSFARGAIHGSQPDAAAQDADMIDTAVNSEPEA